MKTFLACAYVPYTGYLGGYQQLGRKVNGLIESLGGPVLLSKEDVDHIEKFFGVKTVEPELPEKMWEAKFQVPDDKAAELIKVFDTASIRWWQKALMRRLKWEYGPILGSQLLENSSIQDYRIVGEPKIGHIARYYGADHCTARVCNWEWKQSDFELVFRQGIIGTAGLVNFAYRYTNHSPAYCS